MPRLRVRNERIHALLHDGDHRRLLRTLTRLDEVQIASELDNMAVEDQRQILGLLPMHRRPLVLARMRYDVGAGSYLDVLVADRQKLDFEDQHVQSETRRATALDASAGPGSLIS